MDLSTAGRPTLRRYLACLVYEAVLLAAWLMILGALFLPIDLWLHPSAGTVHVPSGWERSVQTLWYGLGLLAYFVFFWVRSGQTLAMKTWKVKLVSLDGAAVRPVQAVVRFIVASVAIPCFGLSWLWAFGSPNRLWLHDQLSKTVLIRI